MRSALFIQVWLLTLLLSACDSGGNAPLRVTATEEAATEEVEPVSDIFIETGTDTDTVTETSAELVFGAAVGEPADIGSWGSVLDWPHIAVSMAALPDGRVLTYSGSERRTWPTTEQTYSAIWNPITGTFEENLHAGHNMFCAAMSMTADGKVLVNGGRNQGNSPWTTLFDYANDEWQTVENMASGGRWYPTSLATGDGKIMTAMGSATNTRNPDLWDPDTGWRVLNGVDFLGMRQRNNELGRDNSWPILSVAPDGNIFHYWDTVENHMINPMGSGEVRTNTAVTDGDNHAGGVHLTYDIGKMISTGRNDGSWGGNATGAANNAFTIDLNGSVPDIRATGSMAHRRKFHQLIPLPTGEVLVVGGNTSGAKFEDVGSVMEPEIWNPATGQWRGMANMAVPRDYHSTAMLLADGRVITAGGGYHPSNPNRQGNHQDAQIFSPPYLYSSGGNLATRPEVTATDASVDAGDALEVITAGDIDYFSLIRMSATTHAVNTDARFYKPEFAATGNNRFSVTINQNPNVSIPGYWMLFAVDTNGVPSEAQVIRITALDTRLENLALQGTATQSSTFSNQARTDSLEAARAIDSDLSGAAIAGSMSHTQIEAQPWWELDLGRVVDIDTIRLWNRTDCCSDRLSNFHVFVSAEPFGSTDLALTRSQLGVTDFPTSGVAGRQTDIKVSRVGRYVRVQLAGNNALQLAEVQVFGSQRTDINNLALSGTASQSSTYRNSELIANKAIDGFTDGNNVSSSRNTIGGSGGSAFDLSCTRDEVLVGIFGNANSLLNRVGARCVSVAQNGSWIGQPRDTGTTGTAAGSPYSASCPSGWAVTGFEGRADSQINQVQLQCQKLVSASTVSGVIQPLPRAGSNNGTAVGPFNCAGGVAAGLTGRSGASINAIGLQCPGARNGVLSHTDNDINPWWELDLGRLVDIDSVVIHNRTDCCAERLSDFHVLVSDRPFNSKSLGNTIAQPGVLNQFNAGAAAQVTNLAISRSGRYIRVQLDSNNLPAFLHMAEVQVFGTEQSAPLVVQPIIASPVQQGTSVNFAANASGGVDVEYRWNFGDGNLDTAYRRNPEITHTYARPGRYVVSLTVRDASGQEIRSTFTQVVHPPVQNNLAQASRGLLEHSTADQVWNVNPDNDTVAVVDTDSLSLLAEIEVGDEPVSVAEANDGNVWVVNRQSATISVVSPSSLAVVATYPLPRASQPYGIVTDANGALVALQATGEVQRVAAGGALGITADVGANPRHLALTSDSNTLYVSRYITDPLPGEDTAIVTVDDGTQQYGGEVLVLDVATLTTQSTIVMKHINRIASEHEGPGVPNYLGPVVIAPDGDTAWLPSKQDNILGGALRGGAGITFDQTVRAITSKISLTDNREITSSRIDHDNASVAASSAFDPLGVTLFTSLEGNRQISVIDVQTGIEIGRFDTGHAPQSIEVSNDGRRLYVHNFMDRTVGVYDIEGITQQGLSTASVLATINTVGNEALTDTVLRGKQLFYDSRDDRLAGLDYMSCASCHVDGEHDGRTWDFTSLGEGLRNTITLKGRAGTGHGILHWTGNFDEVQDFEGQIREFAGGTGLMNDADFAATAPPLGAAKAGLSADLDALAAYMESLDTVDPSPWRNADGTMTNAALNGESLFVSKGCATCHSGDIFTDSNSASLHDVGSLMAESGQRLGAPLTGLDTPTLLGLWRTAPYLHDGSAPTVEDAITAHLSVTVTAAEQIDLAAYLLQLEGNQVAPPVLPPVLPPTVPPVTPPTIAGVSNPLGNTTVVIDGSVNEWSGLATFGNDPDDATGANTIDWAGASVAHNDDNFYITYSSHGPVAESWGYGIFIDVDGDINTGFKGFSSELPVGADYLIEGRDVQRYTGAGTDWSWDEIGLAEFAINQNNAELAVPRSLLGDPASLRLFFNGNNAAVGGSTLDFFPNGVADASLADDNRFFTYSIANNGGNSPPIALAQNLTVAENGQLSIVLTGTDLDADTLTYEVIDQPSNGSLAGTPPAVVYTPDAGYRGTDAFTFTVSDATSTSAVATVSIINIGEAPSNETTITVDGSLAEWAGISSFGLDPVDATSAGDQVDWREAWVAHDSTNFYFAYRNDNPVALSWGYGIYIDTDNSAATGFQNFDGSYPVGADYLLEANELLRYTGFGNNWSWTTVHTVDIQFNGKNAEFSVPRDLMGDPAMLQLFYVGENAAFNGTTVDYYPDPVLDAGTSGRFFVYDVANQSQNVAPVAASQLVTVPQDTSVSVNLSATDANGDSVVFQITRQPSNGSLSGVGPALQYTPDAGFSGGDSFEFLAKDGQLSGSPAVVTITVNPAMAAANDSNFIATLTIDGSLQDWAGLTPLAADAADIPASAEEVDFRQGYIAHSGSMIYLAYQNDTVMNRLTYGHAAFIGTDDDNSTGFNGFSSELPFGADFLLEGTDLYGYSGTGTNWLWTYVATVSNAQVGSIAELGLSRAQLGNPSAIEIFWRGNNEAVNGVGIDFYPDAAGSTTAPLVQRRFRYELQP